MCAVQIFTDVMRHQMAVKPFKNTEKYSALYKTQTSCAESLIVKFRLGVEALENTMEAQTHTPTLVQMSPPACVSLSLSLSLSLPPRVAPRVRAPY